MTNLHPNIIWDLFIFNKSPDETKVGIAGSGVGDFDFLETTFQ